MIEHFFCERGLTSTSANHIANMAKEYVDSSKRFLSNLRFYSEEVSAGGNTYKTELSTNRVDFAKIDEYLEGIANATQLIAWLREALKYKESLKPMDFEVWCEKNNIVIPEKPVKEDTITREEVINSWDMEKYNAYFAHQTNAAVIGAFIHPHGPYSGAREFLNDAINNPTTVTGSGRDITVTRRTPEYTIKEIDDIFFGLQSQQREEQSLHNKLEYELQSIIENDNIEKVNKYHKELQEYKSNYDAIYTQYCVYAAEESKRLKDLKISIPASLKGIYTTIQGLGK